MKRVALAAVVACASPPAVSGTVVDDTGTAVAGAKLEVCNESLCTLATADERGAFLVSVPAGGGYHVIAHAPASDSDATSAGIAVVGDVSGTVAVAPIVIPRVGALDDLTVAAPSVQGAPIPPADWPRFDAAGETVLAMWALAPWATYAPHTGVTIQNHFGLGPGTTAHVFVIDDTSAALLPPTQATVSADGTTLAGATIDRVTWVVLATP